ncbi:MAG: hypothetical protein HY816_20210 [Candidatus Wallbacteria bacterium]|nr:hypothetical protein [Candidatus Wallbacteria bacterium]
MAKPTLYLTLRGDAVEGPRPETLERVAAAFQWTTDELRAKIAEASAHAAASPASPQLVVSTRPRPGWLPDGAPRPMMAVDPPPGLPTGTPVWAAACLAALAELGEPVPPTREAAMLRAYDYLTQNVMRELLKERESREESARVQGGRGDQKPGGLQRPFHERASGGRVAGGKG